MRQQEGICRRDRRLLESEEEQVEKGWRTQARLVLLQQMAPAYQQAVGSQKQVILDEFVTATGYARKYA